MYKRQNIYSSLTDIYKKEGNVSKVNELSEKLFELNKKNAGDNEEEMCIRDSPGTGHHYD